MRKVGFHFNVEIGSLGISDMPLHRNPAKVILYFIVMPFGEDERGS